MCMCIGGGGGGGACKRLEFLHYRSVAHRSEKKIGMVVYPNFFFRPVATELQLQSQRFVTDMTWVQQPAVDIDRKGCM